ncbi:transcriptional regulator, GntR family [Austwickia chelonae]|uniref:Putative GntR family transcriptional regulator n=1 Tax=Austwickia chelonae NBRC 105200 TaxID=1184607 RepID=K6V3P9_9MICO|nr:FCD domain-containing protein [Austwickia chelonae]GAB76723.1 putative GntR family transcriptional regulator [Austwickia chelonae NBRC 105200]SEW29789.1 transcriptional regulator, GntR family [Austwickia chelonae]
MNDGPAGDQQTWRKITKTRAYEEVIARIEEQILNDTLNVGDRLPPERDLATKLGVSRAAVREALRVLESQGVLKASVGVGRDGGTIVCAMPTEALSRVLRLHVALSNFPMSDVIEARVMLERWSARLAARARQEKHVAELRRLVEAMEDPATDRSAFNDLDTDFHVTLAAAGENVLVADMTIAIRESMRIPILTSFQAMEDWDTFVAHLRDGHRRIYLAVAAQDEDAAAAVVEDHIRFAYSALGWRRPRGL